MIENPEQYIGKIVVIGYISGSFATVLVKGVTQSNSLIVHEVDNLGFLGREYVTLPHEIHNIAHVILPMPIQENRDELS